MSRTRLAAAAGVAALTLGATVAVADPITRDSEQTVTITVQESSRSISVGEPETNLVVEAGGDGTESESTDSTLSYNNGASAAKITVEVTSVTGATGTLGLDVEATNVTEGMATAAVNFDLADTPFGAVDLVNAIDSNGAETGEITYSLTGTAPTADNEVETTIEVELKFTITDDD